MCVEVGAMDSGHLRGIAMDLVAGSVGGAAGIVVGQPLDVIKVRMQAGDAGGPLRVLQNTVRHEGATALFKGLVAPCASQGAFTSLSFIGYNSTLAALTGKREVGQSASAAQIFVAGSAGGALTTLVTTPCELVKVCLQVDHTKRAVGGGVRRVVRERLAAGGPAGLYAGWGVTLLRDTPATGVYFLVYYGLKDWAVDKGVARTGAELLAGGVAGVVSWGTVVPVDVVKTRVQADACLPRAEQRYRGAADCARRIAAEEGMGAFVRGAGPLLLRAFPVCAVTFMTYEKVMRFLEGDIATAS